MNKNDLEMIEQFRKWKFLIDEELMALQIALNDRESFLLIFNIHTYSIHEILESKE
ncbi:MAG: hypothetical protein R2811_04110 [Flavobacteriales bacterium]